MPLISICIPAYNKPESLQRLLESITIQTCKSFEVIITDDSSTDVIENIIPQFSNKLLIHYYHNEPAKGMPENWNYALSIASGEWIKIMHDDDWFCNEYALQHFVNEIKKGDKFIVAGFINVYTDLHSKRAKSISRFQRNMFKNNPFLLFANNIIGPPSTTLLHKTIIENYDRRFRWRVDVELYIRLLLKTRSFHYIDKPLINIGISNAQITYTTKNNPVFEIPELYYFFEKYTIVFLNNVRIYDAIWRILRNTNVKSTMKLSKYWANNNWPPAFISLVSHLKKIPLKLLRLGAISKLAMLISYSINRSKIK